MDVASRPAAAAVLFLAAVGTAAAGEHPGKAYIEKNGYRGPSTCEAADCHPGTAKRFLSTVHWTHASKAPNVENLDPDRGYGMKNRIYTMCNGNDIVNNLKEIFNPATGKTKFSGCNTCHPGDHLQDVGSTGPEAEQANDGLRLSCAGCHEKTPHKDQATNRHTATFIGPKGSRRDTKSRIFPFKIYEGKAFFDKKTGTLLSMDFAQPMATGDALAGVASAAKTLGIAGYEPVPGWQTIYFASSHLVTKEKALSCANCRDRNGVLDWKGLGYADGETERLTSAGIYFEKAAKKQQEEEW